MSKSNSRIPPKGPGPSVPPALPSRGSRGLPKLYEESDDPSKTMRVSAEDARPTQRPSRPRASVRFPEPPATAKELPALPSLRADEPDEGTSTTQTAIKIHPTGAAKRAMLTVLTGLSTGQVIAIKDGEIVLGRGSDCTVVLKDQGISREHCRITSRHGRRPNIRDLGSTNGMFVDGKRVASAKLNGGERIQLGSEVVMRFSFGDETEEQVARQLYETSTRDRLTSCYGRGFFDERLAAEIAYSRRHKSPLGVILLDIDHFKKINDEGGHAAGDHILREVAQCVQKLVRAEDILARYGGEEFVMIVRGIKQANIVLLAERVRKAVETLQPQFNSRICKVTVSLGVASWDEPANANQDGVGLVRLADERMYQAKRKGRNRTCGE